MHDQQYRGWSSPASVQPRGPQCRNGELIAWGAHGGAGASTLAALLGSCWDMSPLRHRPDPRYPAVTTYGRPLIVVCRNTVASAERATAAVMAVAHPGGQVAALAIVADGAGREPRDASARFRLLESRVGQVVRVPFVPALRLVDDPTSVDLPRRAQQAIEQLRALAVQPAAGLERPALPRQPIRPAGQVRPPAPARGLIREGSR